MTTATAYKHIVKRIDTGEPIIQGTRISVRDIVEHWKMGVPPEGIPAMYQHIHLAQVFEALAYYQDNTDEVEEYIRKNKVPENLSGTSLPR